MAGVRLGITSLWHHEREGRMLVHLAVHPEAVVARRRIRRDVHLLVELPVAEVLAIKRHTDIAHAKRVTLRQASSSSSHRKEDAYDYHPHHC